MSTEPSVIRNPAQAIAFCERLSDERVVGIDTEIHHDSTYFSHLFLVQFVTSQEIVLFDPVDSELRPADLRRVLTTIREQDILVAGHALQNDLEILLQVTDVLPTRAFDTQIAASFLGKGAQIGLKDLVSNELGVEMEKGHATADWSRRPLPPQQLAYAVADVAHLLPLVARLQAELERRGRLSWFEEECACVLAPEKLALIDPTEAWKKVKKKPRENSAAFPVLQELAAERERIARDKDVPRIRILPDDILVDLATRAPSSSDVLKNDAMRHEHGGLRRYADHWLAAIDRADKRSAQEPGASKRSNNGEFLTGPQRDMVDLMRLLVARRAVDEDLAVGLLAAPLRNRIAGIVQSPPADRTAMENQLGLCGWRAELVGETLWKLVSGSLHATCVFENGALELRWTSSPRHESLDGGSVQQLMSWFTKKTGLTRPSWKAGRSPASDGRHASVLETEKTTGPSQWGVQRLGTILLQLAARNDKTR